VQALRLLKNMLSAGGARPTIVTAPEGAATGVHLPGDAENGTILFLKNKTPNT
jgi:hypothetical protein